MAIELELALDRCLEQLANGASLEECLAQYPGLRQELAPLLSVAQKTAALAKIRPAPDFRQRGRAQLLAHMNAHPKRRSFGFAARGARYAALLAVLVLALSTTGTAFAQQALPGEPLYGWKLASEQVWRAFQEDKLNADQAIAERRLQELAAVQDDSQLNMQSADLYTQAVEQVRQSAEEHPDQIEAINQFLSEQQGTVRSLIKDVRNTLPDVDQLLGIINTATDIPLLPDLNITGDGGQTPSNSAPSDGSPAPAEDKATDEPNNSILEPLVPEDDEDQGPLQNLQNLIEDTIDSLPLLP